MQRGQLARKKSSFLSRGDAAECWLHPCQLQAPFPCPGASVLLSQHRQDPLAGRQRERGTMPAGARSTCLLGRSRIKAHRKTWPREKPLCALSSWAKLSHWVGFNLHQGLGRSSLSMPRRCESSRACPAGGCPPLEHTNSSPWAHACVLPFCVPQTPAGCSAAGLPPPFSPFTPLRSFPTLQLSFSCTPISIPPPAWLHHVHLYRGSTKS